MISQYQFAVTGERPLRSSDGYKFYSWLQQLLPDAFCDYLHQNIQTPIAQHLYCDQAAGKTVWTVSLLGAEAGQLAASLLEDLTRIELHTDVFEVQCLNQTRIDSVQGILYEANRMNGGNRTVFQFCSPTSFKQNDRYALFPQERLILQSLISKWDELFPEYPLNDPDAKQMLEDGLHISDYRLRSARYALKGVKIPGFIGELTLDAHLSAPMQQLWNSLCVLAPFTGIGIKTALGMGGVRLIRSL